MQTTTLYRAVSFAEFIQLTQTGRFEIVGGSVEGKYFAENMTDAAAWGNLLFGASNFRIVEVILPTSIAAALFRIEPLDGIGPARFADIEQLEGVAVSIREVTR
jgi:hypothetical protein